MIDQVVIFLVGTTCVVLSSFNFPAKPRRLIPFIGLAGEPFWYHATWVADQWGMFAWTFLTTAIFVGGIWSWVKGRA